MKSLFYSEFRNGEQVKIEYPALVIYEFTFDELVPEDARDIATMRDVSDCVKSATKSARDWMVSTEIDGEKIRLGIHHDNLICERDQVLAYAKRYFA